MHNLCFALFLVPCDRSHIHTLYIFMDTLAFVHVTSVPNTFDSSNQGVSPDGHHVWMLIFIVGGNLGKKFPRLRKDVFMIDKKCLAWPDEQQA